jgi:cell division protein ZipA
LIESVELAILSRLHRRSAGRADLLQRCDEDAILVLKAHRDTSFDGRKIWDAMYSLGLEWGDMDHFHWGKRERLRRQSPLQRMDSHRARLLLPEIIAAGKVMTRDLVFSFSVPRSPAPAEVFNEMIKAAQYAQLRLGGAILGDEDRPFVKDEAKKRIEDVVRRLIEAGFPPGEGSTLRLF